MTQRLGLALALAAGLSVGLSSVLANPSVPPARSVSASDDHGVRAGSEALPIRRVTLYASGVGSFQHMGRITGTQTVAMRFKTDQINDILKSMVLLDLDGGDIGAVTYASQEPLERRLASFGIDISKINSTTDLLAQLRGSGVRIVTPDGRYEGAVLAVENRTTLVSATQGGNHAHYQEPYVTIVTDTGLRSFAVSGIRTLEITDERLQGELSRALLALAEHRADRSKAVEVTFAGGENVARRVAVSYVSEMPVWKSSYRLVLPDPGSGEQPTLQAWAIVENTTDQDWEGVELSLASGRPVSFVMNLYQTMFAPRPEVPVPYLAAVAPRVIESAREVARMAVGSRGVPVAPQPSSAPFMPPQRQSSQLANEGLPDGSYADYSARSQATAGTIGDQFFYTIDVPVDIRRMQSAMLPIANTTITGRRISLYNNVAMADFPMRGVELTNDSGLHLMPGPITVYDGNYYAGDSQIPHTSRNADRLLTYAVDLDCRASREESTRRVLHRFSVIDGMIRSRSTAYSDTTYTFSNASDSERIVIVEHPRRAQWNLVNPQEAKETTASFLRFEVKVPAGETATLKVEEDRAISESIGVDRSLDNIAYYRQFVASGLVAQELVDALKHIQQLNKQISELSREISLLVNEVRNIEGDQVRMRSNMERIDRASDLYQRYMRTLNAQEDRLEEIREEQSELTEQIEKLRTELSDYMGSLKID
ncbi:MAG: hypothetical protein EA380_08100 [Phycisphaeraceae bacterium]|nr:MAG: hypothetical protein EA380_08100 [Phycisphaeraceae bacterium]